MNDASFGNVGVPVPCCEIRLADVPEMKYTTENKSGEVCIRGLSVFSKYYQDEEKTYYEYLAQ
jgi:long-chain acyl-CoA synthetase